MSNELFSQEYKATITLAMQAARGCGSELLRPVHLLAGLLKTGSEVVRKLLAETGIDADALKKDIDAWLVKTRQAGTAHTVTFSAEAKAIFEVAVLTAKRGGQRLVGIGHLLASLIFFADKELAMIMSEKPVDGTKLQELLKQMNEEQREHAWQSLLPQLPSPPAPQLRKVLASISEQARQALEYAYAEAQYYTNPFFDVEHLFLGLVSMALDNDLSLPGIRMKDVEIAALRRRVEDKIDISSAMAGGEIAFTIRAKKVVELAAQEAFLLGDQRLKHHHLWLGLLGYEKSFAGDWLHCDLPQARAEMIRLKEELQPDSLPAIDLARYKIDRDLLALVPAAFAKTHLVVPIYQRKHSLTVAVPESIERRALEELEALTKMKVAPVIASEQYLRLWLEKKYPTR